MVEENGKTEMTGWVYAFHDVGEGIIKIGRSGEQPLHRMAVLENEHRVKLEAIFICYCNRYGEVEKRVHQRLKHRQVGGRGTEWFDVVPLEAIDAIITAVVELDACVPVPWPPGERKNQINIVLSDEQAKVMDALRGRERIPPTRNAYARWLLAEALVTQATALAPLPKPKRKAVPRAA